MWPWPNSTLLKSADGVSFKKKLPEGGGGGEATEGATTQVRERRRKMGEKNMFTSGGWGLRRSLRFPLLERLPERRRVRFPLGFPRRNMRKAHLSSSLSLPLGDLPLLPPLLLSLFYPPALSNCPSMLPFSPFAPRSVLVHWSRALCHCRGGGTALSSCFTSSSRSLKSRLLNPATFLHMKSYFDRKKKNLI